MGKAEIPRINEVAAFLDQYARDDRQALIEASPDLAPLLDVGLLGGEARSEEDEALRAALSAQARVLSVALDAAIRRAEEAIATINARLSRARRLRFISQCFAAIGASSVIAAAFIGKVETLVAGTLTLLSNLTALFSTTIVLGGEGREAELASLARRLVKTTGIAELTKDLVKTFLEIDFDPEEMKGLLQRSNELFSEVMDALSLAGS